MVGRTLYCHLNRLNRFEICCQRMAFRLRFDPSLADIRFIPNLSTNWRESWRQGPEVFVVDVHSVRGCYDPPAPAAKSINANALGSSIILVSVILIPSYGLYLAGRTIWPTVNAFEFALNLRGI